MQVPRHWRMKQQLYRLNGVRYSDGNATMLNRPVAVVSVATTVAEVATKVSTEKPVRVA